MSNNGEANLVAMPGETILCPACRSDLFVFLSGQMRGAHLAILQGVIQRFADGTCQLWCGGCGSAVVRDMGAPDELVYRSTAPRVLVRSGAWVGWRALGGE